MGSDVKLTFRDDDLADKWFEWWSGMCHEFEDDIGELLAPDDLVVLNQYGEKHRFDGTEVDPYPENTAKNAAAWIAWKGANKDLAPPDTK